MGLFDSKSKNKSATTQESTADRSSSVVDRSRNTIAPFLQPDVQASVKLARNQAFTKPTLPDQLVAGLDENTKAGLDSNRQGAEGLAPLLASSNQGLQDTIGGKYTDPNSNPFFQGVSDLVRQQVIPGVDNRFGAAGAFGSPLHQIGISQGITRELSPHLFSAYQQERGIQDDAINNASQVGGRNATAVGDILQDVGNTFQGQEQRELDAEGYRSQYEQEQQRANLADYNNQLAQLAGFFTKSESSRKAEDQARTEASGTSKSKGKNAPGLGNVAIGLSQQIGSSFAGA